VVLWVRDDIVLDLLCLVLTLRSEYEGLKPAEIRAKRKAQGLDKDQKWEIWRDGCEGGE